MSSIQGIGGNNGSAAGDRALTGGVLLERSGRTLLVTGRTAGETLEIRSPSGAVELLIRITAEGPVLQLRSSRLELVATGEVLVSCQRFSVEASADVHIRAAGDIVEQAGGQAL